MTVSYRCRDSFEEVQKALDYDPATGAFRWKNRSDRMARWNTKHAGKSAGHVQKFHADKMYLVIRLNGTLYLAHRVAWLLSTGAWPLQDLDHEDTNSLNNAIRNLRLATDSQNLQNRRANRNNPLGIKGITRHGPKKTSWRARIVVNGIAHQKCSASLEEVITWHRQMAIQLHGAFARTD